MRDTAGNRRLKVCHEDGTPVPVFYKVEWTGSHWMHLGGFTVMEAIAGISRDAKEDLRGRHPIPISANRAGCSHASPAHIFAVSATRSAVL
jgi:hypothetical protein